MYITKYTKFNILRFYISLYLDLKTLQYHTKGRLECLAKNICGLEGVGISNVYTNSLFRACSQD